MSLELIPGFKALADLVTKLDEKVADRKFVRELREIGTLMATLQSKCLEVEVAKAQCEIQLSETTSNERQLKARNLELEKHVAELQTKLANLEAELAQTKQQLSQTKVGFISIARRPRTIDL